MASTTTAARQNASGMPDIKVSARQLFGIDTDMEVPAFSQATEHVPEVDDAYLFDHDTTMARLASGLANQRERHRLDQCGNHRQPALVRVF